MMDVKEIREALERIQQIKWLIDTGPAHPVFTEAQTRLTELKDFISSLSAIAPEAIRRECADKAKRAILSAPSDIVTRAYAASLAEEAIVFSEPAKDDGKPDNDDILAYQESYPEKGWLYAHRGWVEKNRKSCRPFVLIMRAAEVKRRLEEARE